MQPLLKEHLETALTDLLEQAHGGKLLLMDQAMHRKLDLAFPLAFFKSLEVTNAMLLETTEELDFNEDSAFVFLSADEAAVRKAVRLILPLSTRKQFVLALSPRKTRACLEILESHAVKG